MTALDVCLYIGTAACAASAVLALRQASRALLRWLRAAVDAWSANLAWSATHPAPTPTAGTRTDPDGAPATGAAAGAPTSTAAS